MHIIPRRHRGLIKPPYFFSEITGVPVVYLPAKYHQCYLRLLEKPFDVLPENFKALTPDEPFLFWGPNSSTSIQNQSVLRPKSNKKGAGGATRRQKQGAGAIW